MEEGLEPLKTTEMKMGLFHIFPLSIYRRERNLKRVFRIVYSGKFSGLYKCEAPFSFRADETVRVCTYFIQHCFIFSPSDFAVSADAGRSSKVGGHIGIACLQK
jgi:hypothetical protein